MFLTAKKLSGVKKNWPQYVFEFVIIFASLYLTFEVDDYGEYLNNREKEEVYLLSLHEDFLRDINQLERRIDDYKKKIDQADRLKYYFINYENHQDSIKNIYENYVSYNFLYNPVNNTFESLKAGGDMKLISSDKFKILLSELDKSYKSTVNAGETLVSLTESETWQGLFVNAIDARTFKLISEDPKAETKLSNLVYLYKRYCTSYYFFLQGTLEKTKETLEVLEVEMKQREVGKDVLNTHTEINLNHIEESF